MVGTAPPCAHHLRCHRKQLFCLSSALFLQLVRPKAAREGGRWCQLVPFLLPLLPPHRHTWRRVPAAHLHPTTQPAQNGTHPPAPPAPPCTHLHPPHCTACLPYRAAPTHLHHDVTALQHPPQLAPHLQVLLKGGQHQPLVLLQGCQLAPPLVERTAAQARGGGGRSGIVSGGWGFGTSRHWEKELQQGRDEAGEGGERNGGGGPFARRSAPAKRAASAACRGAAGWRGGRGEVASWVG